MRLTLKFPAGHELDDEQRLIAARLTDLLRSTRLELDDIQFPLETGEALRLLLALEYRVSAGDLLAWCTSGVMSVPSIGGKRSWMPQHLYEAIAVCEGRRRWEYTPRHAPKFSNLEREVAEARLTGGDCFADIRKFDVEALLLMMEKQDAAYARHAIRLAIQEKLAGGEE